VPREIALLTNPSSGKGRGGRVGALVLPRLRDAGYLVRNLVGASPEDAHELARQCVEEGIDTVVVVGGDGMVHLAVQALAGSATRLGLVPAGTGNDVARNLGIPRGDPLAATDVVIASQERRIDLARVGARYFVTVLAAGFDAIVNERANEMSWPRGQMRYNLATIAELRTFRPIPYVLDLDGVEERFEAMTVAVGNGPSFGGGLRITEGARLDDGLLDVVSMGPMSKRGLVRTYPQLFRGTHVRHPAYRHRHARRVTVAAPGITAYADGERLGRLPLTVEVAPAALRVLVPGPDRNGVAR
jgi:diacylglycerol kinase (ATP)